MFHFVDGERDQGHMLHDSSIVAELQSWEIRMDSAKFKDTADNPLFFKKTTRREN